MCVVAIDLSFELLVIHDKEEDKMPRQENTKELIAMEALKLFAEKGFERVKISDITDAVGCTPGALYKHYANKEEVYEDIIKYSKEAFKSSMEKERVNFMAHPELREKYIHMTEDEQVETALNLLQTPLRIEAIRNLRKLMMVEQFQREDLAQMFDERYVTSQYEQYAVLFQMQMEAGIIKKGDPYALAVSYISPIVVMVGMVDRQPQKESWAVQQIKNHVRQFIRSNKIEQ